MPLKAISQLYTIPLAASSTLRLMNPGRFWELVSAPAPIGVKVGEMPEVLLSPGQGLGPWQAPDEFDGYELRNPLAEAITIQFWCGYVGFTDNRRDNTESPTESVGRGITSIAGTTATDLVPVITGTRIRRKAVIVSNFDAAVSIYVSDYTPADSGKGNIVATVGPGQCVILPISEPCRLKNTTAGAVSCAVADIYWLRG